MADMSELVEGEASAVHFLAVARPGRGDELVAAWRALLDAAPDPAPLLYVVCQTQESPDVLWGYGLFENAEQREAHVTTALCDAILASRLRYDNDTPVEAAGPLAAEIDRFTASLAVREFVTGSLEKVWLSPRIRAEGWSVPPGDAGEKATIFMRSVAKTGRADDMAELYEKAWAGFDHPDGPEIYTLHRSPENPEIFWCYEQWADLDSCRTHLATGFVRDEVPLFKECMTMRENLWGSPVVHLPERP